MHGNIYYYYYYFGGELFIGGNKGFGGFYGPSNHHGINIHPPHQLTDRPIETSIIDSLTLT